MIKKKRQNQEEEKLTNKEQSADNKIDTLGNPEPGQGIDSQEAASVSTSESAEAKPAGGKAADNVVAEDRKLEEKLAEMQDRYLRLSAEFDNYRKRTLREKMDLSKYAGENIFRGILPLMDDFDRARSHMDTTTDCEAMKNGLELIYNKFGEFLRQNGVKEIESLNTDFNVDMHEAVAKVPAEGEDRKGKVIDVVTKGYYLQDKVLRFAKVVVGE